MNLPTYEDARKAIRGGKDSKAFLHLGIIYSEGIGTIQNDVLAHYYLKKALDLGCIEAKQYINQAYEAGRKDVATEIISAIGDSNSVSSETINKLKVRIEEERIARNYGNLSRLRDYLHLFYPEYNRDKAIDDILNYRDTIDADILFSTSTTDNEEEIYIEQQDTLLRQLYVHVHLDDIATDSLDSEWLGKDESELAQCLVNLTSSYDTICKRNHIDQMEIFTLDSLYLFPYVKVADLVTLRQQAFRCLLSIKKIEPTISGAFLEKLGSDEALLNICETIKDQDIQLFLISFVELNIDAESIELNSLKLLRSFRNKDLAPLVEHMNSFVERLTNAGIQHHLPVYTIENLPPINLSNKSIQMDQPLSNELGVKGKYSILHNSNGEITIMIDAREGEPEDPRFIFDGKMALLFRNFGSNVAFRNIAEEALAALQKVSQVLVAEVLNDDVQREYIAPVRVVKDVCSLIV